MNKEENNSNKCLICGRPTHKESKYCIFHATVREKTEEEFKQALKKYVAGIREKKDYNFGNFIFVGNINFKEDLKINVFKNAFFSGATFEGNVFFLNVTFEEKADFFRTTFKGDTYFTNVPFKGKADFLCATFEGKAEFTGVTFKGNTDFRSTIFVGNAYFTVATFKGKADFTEATFKISTEFKGTTFEGNSNFENVTFKGHTTCFTNAIFEGDANFFVVKFKGNAYFKEATFKEDAYFEEATFEGDADFRLKYFVKILNFSKIKTFSGKNLFIRLNNRRGKISFERSHLENTYLDIELVEDIFIDFTDALLKNTKIKKSRIENHILQEKKKNFYEAQEIYLLLKNNFHSIGKYEDESWAFKKEKDMERLSYSLNSFIRSIKSEEKNDEGKEAKEENSKFILFFNWLMTKNFRKWLSFSFSNIIYGYGERPQNVIFSAMAIIIVFALFFSILGINSLEIIEMEGPTVQEIFNSDSKIVLKGNLLSKTTNYFLDCLYFSVITFTTLGFGDFRPFEGWSRIFAGTEALIGAFMMALFVYTFARRAGGR